jgi:hypothetical protein
MMALSESARVTTAAEARFRIRDANSTPRAIMVVALDPRAARLVEDLASHTWRQISFFVTGAVHEGYEKAGRSIEQWLTDLSGHAADLVAEVSRADIVQLVATAGRDTSAASLIAEACAFQRVKTSGLIINDEGAGEAALSRSLHALRPWVMTLSVVASTDDIDEMLHALGG